MSSEGKKAIQSSWRNMNDNFETKSRSGNDSEAAKSERSSMSGNSTTGYSSRKIKRENKYIKEKEEYLK